MTGAERHVQFPRIGDAFQGGDALSEWLLTVAMASNDLQLVREWLDVPDDLSQRHPYLFGIVVSHVFEIGEYLAARDGEQVITRFVAELGPCADGYRTLLDTYERRKAELAKIRNNRAFHYRPVSERNPPVRQALRFVANEPGVINVGTGSVRFGFAGEVAAAIFTLACGVSEPGADEIGSLMEEVARAVMDFQEFAQHAVEHRLESLAVPAHVLSEQ